MARTVIEYRCLLISPGDVDAERAAISEVVQQWNAQVGDALGARVNLVRRETHSVPDVSASPQAVLNRQIVDESDFAIAVFWGRLGTPTGSHMSGSIEEIDQLRTRGARVLIYFSSAPIPQDTLRDDQFLRLQEFKSGIQQAGLLGSYNDISDLREQALLHLTSVVAGLLQRDRVQPSPAESNQVVLTAPRPDVRVIAYSAEVMPRQGPNRILRVVVQNHSPIVVFVANISIALRTGTMLMAPRDVITGEFQSRRPLQPGESYALNMDGDALLAGDRYSPEDILYVVVTDDVGREYRSSEESMQAVLKQFRALKHAD
jgi:hypothetical protein